MDYRSRYLSVSFHVYQGELFFPQTVKEIVTIVKIGHWDKNLTCRKMQISSYDSLQILLILNIADFKPCVSLKYIHFKWWTMAQKEKENTDIDQHQNICDPVTLEMQNIVAVVER